MADKIMQKFNLRTPLIYWLIITITFIISVLSICFYDFVNYYGLFFAGALILFIGIPHGATDHLVFNSLSTNNNSFTTKINFYLFYICATLTYGVCWYLFPSFSLNIFLAISTYHLGQSNLYYLIPSNKIIKTFIYSCWGLFIISAPIISNPQTVNAISQHFIGKIWLINMKNPEEFLALLIILNFLTISLLFIFKYIQQKDLFREFLNLIVLGILFYTTPLMISFGVYFGLWHSLGSTFDQIEFIHKDNFKLNLINFYVKSIPLSIASISLFIITALILAKFNIQELQKNFNSIVALFFIFLATITLPHTIIRDKFYIKNI